MVMLVTKWHYFTRLTLLLWGDFYPYILLERGGALILSTLFLLVKTTEKVNSWETFFYHGKI